jgi:hypothetical protein
MRRKASALILLGALAGCVTTNPGVEKGQGCFHGQAVAPPSVPGMQGSWGQNVAMIAPYSATASPNMRASDAHYLMSKSLPLTPAQLSQVGYTPSLPGKSAVLKANYQSPADHGLAAPGAMPEMPGGITGLPGMPVESQQGGPMNFAIPPGAVAAVLPQMGPGPFAMQRTQVLFRRPSGMKISWYTGGPAGKGSYSTTPIEVPGRYNFTPGAIYRLKLSNIEGRPGLEIYPTLEVVPPNPRTEAFLAHSSVPVEFTNEDFRQIAEGNYVVKVIYLPDPQYQEFAGTGTEEILSTRLEPGADPILEARRRGSILLVIRMGNVDQEARNTPPIYAPASNVPLMTAPQMPNMAPSQVPGGKGTMLPSGAPTSRRTPPAANPAGKAKITPIPQESPYGQVLPDSMGALGATTTPAGLGGTIPQVEMFQTPVSTPRSNIPAR